MANEKRLIDADALLEKADWYEEYNEITGEEIAFKYVLASDVEEAPTVDAVEVVRCKDCRFCKNHPTSDKVKMCTNEQQWVTECYPLVHDNDFCSYGERKDNERKAD